MIRYLTLMTLMISSAAVLARPLQAPKPPQAPTCREVAVKPVKTPVTKQNCCCSVGACTCLDCPAGGSCRSPAECGVPDCGIVISRVPVVAPVPPSVSVTHQMPASSVVGFPEPPPAYREYVSESIHGISYPQILPTAYHSQMIAPPQLTVMFPVQRQVSYPTKMHRGGGVNCGSGG